MWGPLARFELLPVALMKIEVFWDSVPCSLVDMYGRLVADCFLRRCEFCSSRCADIAKCVGALPYIRAVFELNLWYSAPRLDIVLPSAQSVSSAPRLQPHYWWGQMNKCRWTPPPPSFLNSSFDINNRINSGSCFSNNIYVHEKVIRKNTIYLAAFKD